jgi:diguanylate cyclase (GGDEF)-like protein
MVTDSPANTGIRESDNPVAGAESRGMRWLLLIGALLAALIWVLGWRAGVLSASSVWLLPVLAALMGLYAWLLQRLPERARWVKLAAALTFNAFLVFNVHAVLLRGGDQPDLYKFFATMYWLPLGYGMAFVFLPMRWAIGLALVVFTAVFGPIALWALAGGAPARWNADLVLMVQGLAAAQLAYVVLLRTVATVRADNRVAHERVRLMQTLAATDALTGLPNRRAITDDLAIALSIAQRYGHPVSVALFDVDHFKQINDHHGHDAGDKTLVQVGKTLSAKLRASDRLGRWGGEEFLLVAPNTGMQPALDLADRLRRALALCEFEHGEPVTVSVGVAQFRFGDTEDTLLQRADKALFRAKKLGRDRTEGMVVSPVA